MFYSSLVVEEKENKKWELKSALVYHGNTDAFIVPEGFTTDFASVPKVFWSIVPPYGKYTKAAVVHDYLCVTKIVSREDADGIFLRIMRELGTSWWRRKLMYAAVRAYSLATNKE